jgi:hypothetical protein
MASPAEDRPAAAIVKTLKTGIIDIFRQELPALASLTGDAAYDKVLDDPLLLHECFQLFRRRTDLFSDFVVDGLGRRVNNDVYPLTCGRSLEEIREMVLQAAARRFFRRKLGNPRKVVVPVEKSFTRRMGEAMGLMKPLPLRMRVVPGGGDRFFGIIRSFLRFDWQARLIPPYSTLPPSFIAKHGKLLLEIHEPAEVLALTAEQARSALEEGRTPLFMGPAKHLMVPKGDTVDAELLWSVADQMDLARLLPDQDNPAMRHAISQIAATSLSVLTLLQPVLGHSARLFSTFLFVAYAKLGEDEFRRTFRGGATEWMAKRYVERLSMIDPLPAPSFDAMVPVFSEIFAATSQSQAIPTPSLRAQKLVKAAEPPKKTAEPTAAPSDALGTIRNW